LLSQYDLGMLHRLADVLVGGEVHDLCDAVRAAQVGDQGSIADVAHHQLGAEQCSTVAELHRVEHHHRMVGGAQCAHGV
jgi:hypothetical protein